MFPCEGRGTKTAVLQQPFCGLNSPDGFVCRLGARASPPRGGADNPLPVTANIREHSRTFAQASPPARVRARRAPVRVSTLSTSAADAVNRCSREQLGASGLSLCTGVGSRSPTGFAREDAMRPIIKTTMCALVAAAWPPRPSPLRRTIISSSATSNLPEQSRRGRRRKAGAGKRSRSCPGRGARPRREISARWPARIATRGRSVSPKSASTAG